MNLNQLSSRLALFVCGVVVLGGLTACVSPPTAGTVIRSHPRDNIRENSPLVAKYIMVLNIKYDREINDLKRVQIQVGNVSRRAIDFEYRFRWFDENQYEIRSISSHWRTAHMSSRDTHNIQAVAPNPQVTDFELMIRYPDTW